MISSVWKNSGLAIGALALGLGLAGPARAASSTPKEPEHHGRAMEVAYTVTVTLVRIDDYKEVRRVRDLLKEVSGISAIYPQMETQGLVELAVETNPGSEQTIFTALKDGFGEDFTVNLKNRNQRYEINIAKKT